MPFQKGQSGHPQGRAKGSRNKATMMAQVLIDGDYEKIIEGVKHKAFVEGDTRAYKLLIERLVPPRRSRDLNLELPAIKTASDVIVAMGEVFAAMARGAITAEEVRELSTLLDVGRRTLENVDHESRILELEIRRGGNGGE